MIFMKTALDVLRHMYHIRHAAPLQGLGPEKWLSYAVLPSNTRGHSSTTSRPQATTLASSMMPGSAPKRAVNGVSLSLAGSEQQRVP